MLLSQKRRTFSSIFNDFRNLQKILLTLKAKINFIPWIFRKLLTPTTMVISMPISSWFRTAFASKDVHGSRTLLEPPLQHFHAHFWLIYEKLSRKKSLLVRSEIVGHFGRNYGKRFKRYYFKNGKYFLQHLLHFQNLQRIFIILKKKVSFIA